MARGASRMPCAWARWQESWKATRRASGWRRARCPTGSASSSETSRTFAARAAARSCHTGSCRKSRSTSRRWEPQPAAFTATRSTPACSNASIARRARTRACSRRPECACRAPQQGSSGVTTSKPSAARTRAVAALTSPKTTDWTQPGSRPTRARTGPAAARLPDVRRRTRHGGASSPRGRSGPGSGSLRPSGASASPARNTHGRVSAASSSERRASSNGPRSCVSSIRPRVCSISEPYCTPEGHDVTQASQPRQRSKCSTTVLLSGTVPSIRPAIRRMRPRGESISSPHRFQVGQVGRQKPQWTQSRTRPGSIAVGGSGAGPVEPACGTALTRALPAGRAAT